MSIGSNEDKDSGWSVWAQRIFYQIDRHDKEIATLDSRIDGNDIERAAIKEQIVQIKKEIQEIKDAARNRAIFWGGLTGTLISATVAFALFIANRIFK